MGGGSFSIYRFGMKYVSKPSHCFGINDSYSLLCHLSKFPLSPLFRFECSFSFTHNEIVEALNQNKFSISCCGADFTFRFFFWLKWQGITVTDIYVYIGSSKAPCIFGEYPSLKSKHKPACTYVCCHDRAIVHGLTTISRFS